MRPSAVLRAALAALALSLGACADGSGVSRRDAGPAAPSDAADTGDAGGPVPGDDGGAPPVCDPGDPGSALSFDGVDDHVTMGVAPALGQARFTLEAWVRREGRGTAAGTGVGGIQVVPIVAKGRGESDGSDVDCNYAFGFVGDVLGADFEDMATGANHPVLGRSRVPTGEWHHVAATYDGTTWRLYLDGVLDGQARAAATPRHDSVQHFAIGSALDSMGRAAGRLHGSVDEVRVWSRARTADELARTMYRTLDRSAGAEAEGLVGRWSLDETDLALDGAGATHGTIVGAAPTTPGAVLDQGAPPAITGAIPADGAAVSGSVVELGVGIDGADETYDVTFHLRALGAEDDFTIVVLPDTQKYTIEGNADERFFYDQTRWITENREAYRIVAVIHNGDLVEHGNTYDYEWRVADRAMRTLEEPSAELADGLPYGIAVGNHDETPRGSGGGTEKFNAYFGVARFAGRPYYGGHYAGDTNDDSWFTFAAGGLDFVVVNLRYDETPDPAVLAWARRVFDAHPDAFGILNTHYLIGTGATFGAQGQATYDALRDAESVQLMTCGHVAGESRRTDTYAGHTIHTMLADYQGRADGGSGWLRIWELSPANGTITVRSYSPSLDQWETDANSEFTLPIDLRGAGGAFEERARETATGGLATTTLEGLEPGRVYEWYATVRGCAHEVRTRVARFTTRP